MLLFLLVGLLAAVAVRGAAEVNLCDYNEAMPLLYHEYTSTDCPTGFSLKPDGNCADQIDYTPPISCNSYCQMRSNFYWGREQPFLRVPFCRSGLTCKLSNAVHQGYSWKIKLNQNIKVFALTTGITGGWANKWGWTQSYSFSKTLDKNECGYWTFVPSCANLVAPTQRHLTTEYEDNALLPTPRSETFALNSSITSRAITTSKTRELSVEL